MNTTNLFIEYVVIGTICLVAIGCSVIQLQLIPTEYFNNLVDKGMEYKQLLIVFSIIFMYILGMLYNYFCYLIMGLFLKIDIIYKYMYSPYIDSDGSINNEKKTFDGIRILTSQNDTIIREHFRYKHITLVYRSVFVSVLINAIIALIIQNKVFFILIALSIILLYMFLNKYKRWFRRRKKIISHLELNNDCFQEQVNGNISRE